jgi:ferredoxin
VRLTRLDPAAGRAHPGCMTKLPDSIAPTTEAFLAEAGPRLAALCTACGACLRACPTADLIGMDKSDAATMTQDLRRLARGEPAESPAALKWINACAKSGSCISACPERDKGLDAMLLVRICRQNALNVTHQVPPKHDAAAFVRVKTFARLQLTDEEQEKWL